MNRQSQPDSIEEKIAVKMTAELCTNIAHNLPVMLQEVIAQRIAVTVHEELALKICEELAQELSYQLCDNFLPREIVGQLLVNFGVARGIYAQGFDMGYAAGRKK